MDKKSKIEFYLPPELAKALDKYSATSKKTKEEILRSALIEFFKNHPVEPWTSQDIFEKIARKMVFEESKEK
ncbi:MAG: ribbon-helix-helix protein, CopG family [Candidatus Eremiobacterota bacterium]